MAVSTLDAKTALLVIDLQGMVVLLPTIHPIGEIIARASALADAFRSQSLPVVLVRVDGRPPGRTEQTRSLGTPSAGWSELVAELNRAPSDHVVTKRTPGAFTNTGLEAHLKTLGVTQLVIVGVSTSSGVEATARHAYELGFNVTIAVDATTDLSPDAHAHSVTRVFPKLAETGTTREIIDHLAARGA